LSSVPPSFSPLSFPTQPCATTSPLHHGLVPRCSSCRSRTAWYLATT
jgi:hypothetical protein